MTEPITGADSLHRPTAGVAPAAGGGFHRLSRPAWPVLALLVLADAAALEAALLGAVGLRVWLSAWWPITLEPRTLTVLKLAVLLFPAGYALVGLYPGYGLAPVERVRREIVVTFGLYVALFSWEWLTLGQGWSRGVLLGAMVLSFGLLPVTRAAVREWLGRWGRWGMPVLILGAAQTGAMTAQVLQRERGLGLVPVGFLDDDPAKWGQEVARLPVLGPLDRAEEFAHLGVSTAILAMPGAGRARLSELVHRLPFARVVVVPDLFGMQSLWVSSRDFGGLLGLEVHKNLQRRHNRLLKQAMDYLFGVPLFLLALPLIGAFALWIRRVSPGPAFYTQEREGYGGKTVRVLKLRTMYPDAATRLARHLEENLEARAEWERYFKLKDDPRILPGVGHFLRRTSLDELPQFWHVLTGEMSLVGPRPFPRYHLEKFSPDFRALRHSVRPGITGLWQVSARSDGDLEVQEALDTYYIRNWSPWLDLYLLVRTVVVVLGGRGAY